jgi:hypothetical protein
MYILTSSHSKVVVHLDTLLCGRKLDLAELQKKWERT